MQIATLPAAQVGHTARPSPQPFEPLELKQAAKPAAAAQAPAAGTYVRPGTHIDIKV